MEFKGAILYIAISLLSIVLVGPVLMNSIGKFGVQKEFAKDMIKREVITEDIYKKVQLMQEILAIVLGVLVVGLIVYVGITNGPYSWICIVLGVGLGCFLSRKSIQYSVVTFHTFKAAYKDNFDIDKYNEVAMEYAKEHNLK